MNHTINMNVRRIQVFMFTLGLMLFITSAMQLIQPPSSGDRVSGQTRRFGLKRLNEKDMVWYVQTHLKLPMIDIVLLPPYIMSEDKKTNYSVLSIFRYASWVRRVHIIASEDEKENEQYIQSDNHADYWKTHQRSRIVFTRRSLLTYCLTSPLLSEQFLILKPYYLLTNYLFHWQTFIDNSPVLRSCLFGTGIVPMTREIFNENIYHRMDPKNHIKYAIWKGVQSQKIKFEDNEDHFIPPCSGKPIKTIRQIMVFKEGEIQEYFKFVEINKPRDGPIKLLLCICCDLEEDLYQRLAIEESKEWGNILQIWVYINRDYNAGHMLSFIGRMVVSKSIFIDLSHMDFTSVETVGAEVMKRLRSLSKDQEFKVVRIFSYKYVKQLGPRLCIEVGNKLAAAYNSIFEPFPALGPKDVSEQTLEYHRLQYI